MRGIRSAISRILTSRPPKQLRRAVQRQQPHLPWCRSCRRRWRLLALAVASLGMASVIPACQSGRSIRRRPRWHAAIGAPQWGARAPWHIGMHMERGAISSVRRVNFRRQRAARVMCCARHGAVVLLATTRLVSLPTTHKRQPSSSHTPYHNVLPQTST